jgi:Lon protease-like protein
MVEDALQGDKMIGMIQPLAPRQDNRPLPGAEKESPELYKIGCAGIIESWERLSDGRYFIQIRGIHRFRIESELAQVRGYRRVKALYSDFRDAETGDWTGERQAVLQALTAYGQARGMEVKPEQAVRFSDMELMNLLSASLQFHPAEKQALLEAPTLKEREGLLIDLLRIGAGAADPDDEPSPRTLN